MVRAGSDKLSKSAWTDITHTRIKLVRTLSRLLYNARLALVACTTERSMHIRSVSLEVVSFTQPTLRNKYEDTGLTAPTIIYNTDSVLLPDIPPPRMDTGPGLVRAFCNIYGPDDRGKPLKTQVCPTFLRTPTWDEPGCDRTGSCCQLMAIKDISQHH